MTHKELVNIGAKWLLKNRKIRCPYIVKEFASGPGETPDLFGFMYAGSVLVEVKVSRTDFRADSRKKFRKEGLGIGAYRYYLCPKSLILLNELPAGWGLLYYANGKIQIKSFSKIFIERDFKKEYEIMYCLIRRIAKKPALFNFKQQTGVRIIPKEIKL